jgi:hypothetical protein
MHANYLCINPKAKTMQIASISCFLFFVSRAYDGIWNIIRCWHFIELSLSLHFIPIQFHWFAQISSLIHKNGTCLSISLVPIIFFLLTILVFFQLGTLPFLLLSYHLTLNLQLKRKEKQAADITF